MAKNHLFITLALLALVSLAGCGSSQNVAYLQDADSLYATEYADKQAMLYDARILPKDLLTISISATDPESVRPFNLTVPAHTTGLTTTSQPQLQTYLVDNNGQINFPVLGMLDLKGLTKRQAEQKIAGMLTPYLKENPVVTVSFVNYKISVIGEVLRPNTFTVSNEKINIFEALAMAGDMTIYGKRENVKIIREDAEGNKVIIPMNLNDKNIIFSPYYYLQQNDVVYVEPNQVKAQNAQVGAMTTLWISGASILISIASLVVNILKK
jgi:polysaccharide export outer membrane protein